MGIVGSVEVCISFHSVAGIVVSAPLSGGVFLGLSNVAWVCALESWVSDGSINDRWVLAVVVTSEIVGRDGPVLSFTTFSN